MSVVILKIWSMVDNFYLNPAWFLLSKLVSLRYSFSGLSKNHFTQFGDAVG